MGYISILLALLAGTTKGFFGKKLSNSVTTHRQSVFVNMVRMLMCVFISLGVLSVEVLRVGFYIDGPAWIFGILAGVTISLFMVTWLLVVRRGAFMLISVAQMFGVVVTLFCSLIVFKDPITPFQILAMGILIVAVLVMASYSTKLKGKLSVGTIVLLIVCGLSSGLYDFSLKLFMHYSRASISTLNLISYAIATVVLCLILLFPSEKVRFDAKKMLCSTALIIAIMSACLFINSYFKALANNYLLPAQVYPIYQAGGLIFSALMASIFFKEKITLRCVLGLVLAFIAIILLK